MALETGLAAPDGPLGHALFNHRIGSVGVPANLLPQDARNLSGGPVAVPPENVHYLQF